MQSNKTNILIVEDELLIAENISDILYNEGYDNVQIVTSVDGATEAIEKQKPDLVFTDIALGSAKTGIDLGHLLNEKYKIPFIYITSHSSSQIIHQAKHTSPEAYLTKPFKREDLLVALELGLFKNELKKAIPNEEYLIFKDGHDTIKIRNEEIMWLKAEKNYTAIYPVSGKIRLVREIFTEILERLSVKDFIRIHKSYAINFNFVTEIKSTKVLLKNIELPIGRVYRQQLQNYLKNNR